MIAAPREPSKMRSRGATAVEAIAASRLGTNFSPKRPANHPVLPSAVSSFCSRGMSFTSTIASAVGVFTAFNSLRTTMDAGLLAAHQSQNFHLPRRTLSPGPIAIRFIGVMTTEDFTIVKNEPYFAFMSTPGPPFRLDR